MRKGEVWLINLDPTVGGEIRKSRPAVIVSEDAIGILPLRVIVTLTDWKEQYRQAPWMVQITPDVDNGLSKSSAADAIQIRSVSTTHFVNQIGKVSSTHLDQILEAVRVVIGL